MPTVYDATSFGRTTAAILASVRLTTGLGLVFGSRRCRRPTEAAAILTAVAWLAISTTACGDVFERCGGGACATPGIFVRALLTEADDGATAVVSPTYGDRILVVLDRRYGKPITRATVQLESGFPSGPTQAPIGLPPGKVGYVYKPVREGATQISVPARGGLPPWSAEILAYQTKYTLIVAPGTVHLAVGDQFLAYGAGGANPPADRVGGGLVPLSPWVADRTGRIDLKVPPPAGSDYYVGFAITWTRVYRATASGDANVGNMPITVT